MSEKPFEQGNKASGPLVGALEKRVLKFVQDNELLHRGERLLVGVSGGPDSTALLLILWRLREALSLGLTVAHFDHRLRSREEGEGDLAFVRGLAEELPLPFVWASGDVKGHGQAQGLSLEEGARQLRYDFYAREAARLGSEVVAVGHTASDQAETVLLHLIRGTGLDGLRGMRPRTAWPFGSGPALVRPLLCLRREETERYCYEVGIVPRDDPSNQQLEATRNWIRHQLLPLLHQFNPQIQEALVRLAKAATMDADYIEKAAEEAWQALAREGEGEVSFPRREFKALGSALRRRLLRRGVQRLAGMAANLEAVHWEEINGALAKSRSQVSLPGGIICLAEGKTLRLIKGEPARGGPLPETPLVIPGCTMVPGWTIEAEIIAPQVSTLPESRYEVLLDAAGAGSSLVVRGRRPGDRLRPLGLGGEKKVQDLLVDAKVPWEERDSLPIVCGPQGILWVVGVHRDERAAVTARTSRVLHLRARVTA